MNCIGLRSIRPFNKPGGLGKRLQWIEDADKEAGKRGQIQIIRNKGFAGVFELAL